MSIHSAERHFQRSVSLLDHVLYSEGPHKRGYGTMEEETDSNDTGADDVKLEKPNGGWGWMIVLGVAISNLSTQSMLSVFGLLFLERLTALEIETAGASILMSVLSAVLNFSGLYMGVVMGLLSYRQVAVIGGLFFSAGLALTGFADSMTTLILTYSLFTGIGLGLLQPSTFVAINSYFSTRRGRAVGLSVAGTGVGQMLLPHAVRWLLDEYGFRGTVLLLAGISLNCLVGAALYQPVRLHMKKVKTKNNNNSNNNNIEKEVKAPLLRSDKDTTHFNEVSVSDKKSGVTAIKSDVRLSQNTHNDVTAKCDVRISLAPPTSMPGKDPPPYKPSSQPTASHSGVHKIFRLIGFSLLKDSSFVNLIISVALVYTANIYFSMLFPFLLQDMGYNRSEIALCMSVVAAADIVGRVIIPTVTDLLQMRIKTAFFLGVGASAIARTVLATMSDKTALLVVVAVTGFVRAAIVVNFGLVISDQVPANILASALGLHMVFKGISVMTLGPLIGYIRDYTKSYELCIYIMSFLFLTIPVITWLGEKLIHRCRRSKKTIHEVYKIRPRLNTC